MVKFLSMLLVGWLVADIGRNSMNPLMPTVVLAMLVCIVFVLAFRLLSRRSS